VSGTRGWFGIAMVSAIYLIVAILVIIFMVNLGLKGAEQIKWRFLERHEKFITGIVLIYFIEI